MRGREEPDSGARYDRPSAGSQRARQSALVASSSDTEFLHTVRGRGPERPDWTSGRYSTSTRRRRNFSYIDVTSLVIGYSAERLVPKSIVSAMPVEGVVGQTVFSGLHNRAKQLIPQ